MFILFLMSATISIILMILNFMLAKKEFNEREKPSPFECGFDPMCSARVPFSLQFFLITVIFLIFDVEITLILPIITTSLLTNMLLIPLSFIFFLILIIGLYLEWHQGALEWFE